MVETLDSLRDLKFPHLDYGMAFTMKFGST